MCVCVGMVVVMLLLLNTGFVADPYSTCIFFFSFWFLLFGKFYCCCCCGGGGGEKERTLRYQMSGKHYSVYSDHTSFLVAGKWYILHARNVN